MIWSAVAKPPLWLVLWCGSRGRVKAATASPHSKAPAHPRPLHYNLPMIILQNGFTPQEIRVLQEFRRLNADTLTADQVKAIKHPAGGGEAPAGLVEKGFLTATPDGFTITQTGKDFLAIDARPMFEETSQAAASAAENPAADGV